MSDVLDRLLEQAADDLSADVAVPPVAGVLATAHRRRVLRVAAPAVIAPLLAALVVVAAGVGPSFLLYDRDSTTTYAGDGPELGRAPLPTWVTDTQRPSGDPPVSKTADLLAVVTTKDGRARLLGFVLRSGKHCVALDYEVPFLNSTGGASCAQRGDPLTGRPLVVSGQADATPGAIKRAPLAYGSAPQGTLGVELSQPGHATVIAPARDGGSAWRHRAYFLTSFPIFQGYTARALDKDGRELARAEAPAPDPAQLASACGSASAVVLSHLQRATLVGETWARTHPGSGDKERLRFLSARPGTAPMELARESDAVARMRLALAELSRLGPAERYEFRLAAVVILGDGKTCFSPTLQDTARRLYERSGAGG